MHDKNQNKLLLKINNLIKSCKSEIPNGKKVVIKKLLWKAKQCISKGTFAYFITLKGGGN